MKASILFCLIFISIGFSNVMAQEFEAEDSANILTVSNPKPIDIQVEVKSISALERIVVTSFLNGIKGKKKVIKKNGISNFEKGSFDCLQIKHTIAIFARFKKRIIVKYEPPQLKDDSNKALVRSASINNTGNTTTTTTVTSL